jgi:hypothetical protein
LRHYLIIADKTKDSITSVNLWNTTLPLANVTTTLYSNLDSMKYLAGITTDYTNKKVFWTNNQSGDSIGAVNEAYYAVKKASSVTKRSKITGATGIATDTTRGLNYIVYNNGDILAKRETFSYTSYVSQKFFTSIISISVYDSFIYVYDSL